MLFRLAVSVCPVSVTVVYCVETSERILKLYAASGRSVRQSSYSVLDLMAIF